jgi:hypothetical protein
MWQERRAREVSRSAVQKAVLMVQWAKHVLLAGSTKKSMPGGLLQPLLFLTCQAILYEQQHPARSSSNSANPLR